MIIFLTKEEKKLAIDNGNKIELILIKWNYIIVYAAYARIKNAEVNF